MRRDRQVFLVTVRLSVILPDSMTIFLQGNRYCVWLERGGEGDFCCADFCSQRPFKRSREDEVNRISITAVSLGRTNNHIEIIPPATFITANISPGGTIGDIAEMIRSSLAIYLDFCTNGPILYRKVRRCSTKGINDEYWSADFPLANIYRISGKKYLKCILWRSNWNPHRIQFTWN